MSMPLVLFLTCIFFIAKNGERKSEDVAMIFMLAPNISSIKEEAELIHKAGKKELWECRE